MGSKLFRPGIAHKNLHVGRYVGLKGLKIADIEGISLRQYQSLVSRYIFKTDEGRWEGASKDKEGHEKK